MFWNSHCTKGLVVAVLAAAATLSACVVAQPGSGGGPAPAPAPAPAAQPAPQLSTPCEQRIGNNGGRGFWDVGLGQCWSCPAGSNRTIFDVRGSDACQAGGIFGSMVAAEYLGGS